jgi:hypothetical protein
MRFVHWPDRPQASTFQNSNLEKVRGDALNSGDVDGMLNGISVVIQTLGVGLGDLFGPYIYSPRPLGSWLLRWKLRVSSV